METPSQQPTQGTILGGNIATPPAIPGGQVPGVPDADPNVKAQKLLEMLKQVAQKKQMANTAVPANVPQQEDPNRARNIGMNTGNPHAWGFQRFAASLSTGIRNAVAKQKQDQLLKAEGDWTYLQSSMNELFDAQQSGDPARIKAAQAKVDVTLNDPKKLKNMAKALNQDWLNPEKTTVYGEALKKVSAQVKQQEAQKTKQQQAADNLKNLFKKVLGQKQQLQLTLDEKERMAREIQSKAPTATTVDKETVKEAALEARDAAKAEEKAAADAAKEAAKQKELEQKHEWEVEATNLKQKFTEHRDQMQNTFKAQAERLHEAAADDRQARRDMAMFEREKFKMSEADKKLFAPKPGELDKQVTQSVTSLRQQLAQSQSALKSLKTSASNHWMMGPGKEEIAGAEDNVKTLEKAIAHIEKNRDAVIKGKADLGDVVNKAYDIMGGGGDDAAAPPPPGFVPDKKN